MAFLQKAHRARANGAGLEIVRAGAGERAQFLFIFFVLYRSLGLTAPPWVIACLSIGSFFNPFAFFMRALKPHYIEDAPIFFTLMITVSCILTTIGYGASAWLVTSAVLSSG